MSPKSLTSRHSIDSCLFRLHSWKPFSNPNQNPKSIDHNPNPNPNSTGIHPKRPCLSDRSTSVFSLSIDNLDFSKLSLFDDNSEKRPWNNHHNHSSRMEKLRWSMAKKRRRKGGSRSVSGKSSDRSGTRNTGCRSMATATCSDFMVGNCGTDSSGELFGNHVNGCWYDVSEVKKENGVNNSNNNGNVGGEMAVGFGFEGIGGNESGYGSEPGYRGDVEYGYGDELDDDEDEGARLLLLWGQSLGESMYKLFLACLRKAWRCEWLELCNYYPGTVDIDSAEMVGENSFSEQKTHHRGRRKKHDFRMVDSVR